MGKVKKEKNSKNSQEKESNLEVSKKRKNVEKKKSSVEENTRRYGYISTSSVISMAEAAGFSGIQEDVAKNLAEDVTYRLRYIIQQCKKYMIHCKHKKLSSSDINEVLKMCDIPAMYGYTVDRPLHDFIYIKEADVFVLDDNVIDLPSFALNEILVQKKPPFLVAGLWLKPEDSSIKSDIKTKSTELRNSNLEVQSNSDSLKISTKTLSQCETPKVGTENAENETKIPTNLIKYYGITCNTILGHSDLKIIFEDLATNSRIVPIIPYFLNFITISLNKLSSERQLKRLLQTVEALSKNKMIDFTPYSATTRVINAMLLVVAIDKKSAKISCDYQLRLYAARVLSLVLVQWCSRDEQKTTIIKKMGKLLSDFKASSKVHYGAIALLTALGFEALSSSLWKILKQYLEYLEEMQQNSHINDLVMLEEVVLGAAVVLYRCQNHENESSLPELDGYLSSYFGDALCSIRRHLSEAPGLPRRDGTKETDGKCSKVIKYMNSRYKATVKKLSLEDVFSLPKTRKRKNTRIMFKFAGAIPVPEVSLKRRRLDSQYSQFIAGKESEGHVVVAGRCRRTVRSSLNFAVGSLFSLL